MIFGKFQISAGTVCKINRSVQIPLGQAWWVGKACKTLSEPKRSLLMCVPMEDLPNLLDKDKGLLQENENKESKCKDQSSSISSCV